VIGIDIFIGRIQETGDRIQEKETGRRNGCCLLYSVSRILLTNRYRKNTGDRRQNIGEGKQGVENSCCLLYSVSRIVLTNLYRRNTGEGKQGGETAAISCIPSPVFFSLIVIGRILETGDRI
jgi:hypothetical protein